MYHELEVKRGTRARNYSRFSMILSARFQITTIRRLVTNTNLDGLFYCVEKNEELEGVGIVPLSFFFFFNKVQITLR